MAVIPLPDAAGVFTTANHDAINLNFAVLAGGTTNPAFPQTDNITAHPGGGQGSATQLTTVINHVSVVGTDGDSVKLPLAPTCPMCIVINDSANVLQVFGAGTDTINNVATATGVAVPPKTGALLFQTTPSPAGKWYIFGLPWTSIS